MADEHTESDDPQNADSRESGDSPAASDAPRAARPARTDGDASADAIDALAEEALRAANDAVTELQNETAPSRPDGPVDLPDFGPVAVPGKESDGIGMLGDVELRVKIELGRTVMYVEDVLRLNSHSIIELDKAAGDPVDIYVNDRHVARGEVLVLNDNFCVRVSEIIHHPTSTQIKSGT
jgi:flagellar motor switch protein FliN/FliY